MGFGMFVAANALFFRSVGLELPVPDIAAICLAAGAVAALPVSIGGLGLREGSLLHLLSLWGVSAREALPILVVECMVSLLLPIFLWLVWRLGVRIHRRVCFAGNDGYGRGHRR